MAQDGTTAGGASYTLDNVTFPVGRNKLQSIFDAIRSTNIGNTAPDLVAGQFWIDNNTPSTTVWTLYFYDGTDSIQFATIDTINNTVNFIDSTFTQLTSDLSTNGNDINFGDNDKAQFGDSGDLQIYHDGSSSRIAEVGSGRLTIETNGDSIRLTKGTTENMLIATPDGSVDLYYNNSQKLATTSSGIDVTGTVVSDGLTVGTSSLPTITLQDTDVSANAKIEADGNGTLNLYAAENSGSGILRLYTAGSQRLRVANNGDISFYEDTGTTPKFYWDASEERLGIGTSSPGTTLEVTSSVNSISSIFGASLTQDDWTGIGIGYKGSSYTKSAIIFERTDTDFARGDLHFAVDGGADGGSVQLSDSKMVITSGGNVGIGTSSPNVSGLEISRATGSSSPTPVELRLTTTTNASNWSTTDPYARISFYSDDGSTSGPKIMNTIETITTTASGGISNLVFKGRTNKLLELNEDISYFYTGNTEAMRLDSSQNLDMTNGGGNIKLASGAGIDFSATAGTGTSELLDDYETGTFTVGTNSDATGAFTNETGEYTKIGNVVHVRIVMKVSTNFTSSNIDGLPFIADHATTSSSIFATNAFLTRSDTNGVIFGVISDGFSILTFKENNDFDDAHLPNTTNDVYRISFWYYSV